MKGGKTMVTYGLSMNETLNTVLVGNDCADYTNTTKETTIRFLSLLDNLLYRIKNIIAKIRNSNDKLYHRFTKTDLRLDKESFHNILERIPQ